MQIISKALQLEIDKICQKFPADARKSAIVSSLLLVQKDKGWISEEAMQELAEYLAISQIEVYEVATFYSLFNLEPAAEYKLQLCTNVSCMLNGSEQILEFMKTHMQLSPGQFSRCRRFSLHTVECLGACSGAPVMQINDKYHENLDNETLGTILADMGAKL